ncbi:MAG: hypothetical protein LBG93_06745 [Treponema sp.]|jgi:hypothetical protein|nr:hypothetical protein [Treponema sp.]
MKKYIFAATIFFASTAALFSQAVFSPSIGGGTVLGGVFTRYSLSANGHVAAMSARQQVNQFDYGVFAFFSTMYTTLSVSFQNGVNSWREPAYVTGIDHNWGGSGRGWEQVLSIGFLGRVPFTLNGRLTVFPMLGIEYHIALLQRRNANGFVYDRASSNGAAMGEHDRDNNPFQLSDFNAFWIMLGGGLEFDLSDRVFLRSDLLYGVRLMTASERKNLGLIDQMTGDSSPRLGGLTTRPSLRFSAGWRIGVTS